MSTYIVLLKKKCSENLALNTLILVSSENEHSFPIAALESFPTWKMEIVLNKLFAIPILLYF